MRRIEITKGTCFGEMKVIQEVESKGKRRFACECKCGQKVTARLDHLRSGHTSSCGRCGILHDGKRKTLRRWASLFGIPESTLRARLKVMGIREALERG